MVEVYTPTPVRQAMGAELVEVSTYAPVRRSGRQGRRKKMLREP